MRIVVRSNHPRASGIALGVVVATVVAGFAGSWNPSHLTYLDIRFTAPYLGAAFLGGLALLWHLHARGRLLRVLGFLGLLAGLLGGAGLLAFIAWVNDGILTQQVAGGRGDVEGELTSSSHIWQVWLRADRGLLSRQHMVVRIGYGDSVPPPVEARFVGDDELVITAAADGSAGEIADPSVEIYRLRFDPHDLDIVEQTCARAGDWPEGPPGCV
jgi:hypothetical protein